MTSAPASPQTTALHIGAQQMVVRMGDAELSLPIGFLSPGQVLRHQPPTPLELENAIAAIEDAVMPLARSMAPATRLVSADALALRLCELAGPPATVGGSLGIAAVETLFNEMVDISQGRPSAGSPFLDAALCGYLLVLREFMHHLGFESVVLAASTRATS